jgi:hypothetical protein
MLLTWTTRGLAATFTGNIQCQYFYGNEGMLEIVANAVKLYVIFIGKDLIWNH